MEQMSTDAVRFSQRAGQLRVIALACVAFTGCGAAEPADVISQGVPQPLMRYNNVTLWPNGQVPVCFSGRASSQEAGWIKSVFADSWTAVANIDFQFSDTCPFPGQTNYVRVNWLPQDGWGVGGNCGIAVGSPTVANLYYCASGDCNAAEYEEAFKGVVVHELGHGLGFAHEHQRGDATPPAGCLPAEPQRAQYPTDKDYQDAHASWVTNIATIGDGIYLSSPYDADSIMNYCRGVTATQPTPLGYQARYQAADRLSVGDLYGAQQAYGIRMPYWLHSPSL